MTTTQLMDGLQEFLDMTAFMEDIIAIKDNGNEQTQDNG